MIKTTVLIGTLLVGSSLLAAEYHVSPSGNDKNKGTRMRPYRTISAAARVAQPGDVITVHAGTYRERISPPRGGESDVKRIVYQAAPGERVEIKGSEVVKNWVLVQDDVWKVTLPNSFFGSFNPYSDLIRGNWFTAFGREHHTGSVYLNGKWLTEAAKLDDVLKPGSTNNAFWFGRVDATSTTIWAQFKGVNPNEALVEINVRSTVFTPEKTGINYLTVRGFTMCHAASNWAPPTAGQFGLISAYWCKGWIIENNEVSYSRCSGIALGKHGDEFDNKSASAEGYVETIKRAYTNGWTRENIGHHIVRNNHIHHCEQTGIVGSMGSAFSTITGNEIHDIWVLRLFSGAEMAGIKFHAAVDTEISGNHIYRVGTCGLWLDWMTQGTRVTRNLMHDNRGYDILLEVNHGPFLAANNILLSAQSVFSMSNGGAFAHNLCNGQLKITADTGRKTPCLEPHDVQVNQLKETELGDDRWLNNLFIGAGNLSPYDTAKLPVAMGGNVFLKNATPSKHEVTPLVKPGFDPAMKFTREPDGACYLEITLDKAWGTEQTRKLVSTETLGRAALPGQAYELPDGSPLKIDTDYFGKPRNAANPFPGPFEIPEGGKLKLKVWPMEKR